MILVFYRIIICLAKYLVCFFSFPAYVYCYEGSVGDKITCLKDGKLSFHDVLRSKEGEFVTKMDGSFSAIKNGQILVFNMIASPSLMGFDPKIVTLEKIDYQRPNAGEKAFQILHF